MNKDTATNFSQKKTSSVKMTSEELETPKTQWAPATSSRGRKKKSKVLKPTDKKRQISIKDMMKLTREKHNTSKQTDNKSIIDDDKIIKKIEENETYDVRLMNDSKNKNELVTVKTINHNMQHPLRSHVHAYKSDTQNKDSTQNHKQLKDQDEKLKQNPKPSSSNSNFNDKLNFWENWGCTGIKTKNVGTKAKPKTSDSNLKNIKTPTRFKVKRESIKQKNTPTSKVKQRDLIKYTQTNLITRIRNFERESGPKTKQNLRGKMDASDCLEADETGDNL